MPHMTIQAQFVAKGDIISTPLTAGAKPRQFTVISVRKSREAVCLILVDGASGEQATLTVKLDRLVQLISAEDK